MDRGISVGAFALLMCSACSTYTTTAVNDVGFYHRDHPIFIPHEDPQARAPLGPDWVVSNFVYDDGRPTTMKSARPYTIQYELERDNGERFWDEATRNDLLLEHRHHDGTIWLRSQPFAANDSRKEPSVIVRRLAEQLRSEDTRVTLDAQIVVETGSGLRPGPIAVRGCRVARHEAAMATLALMDAVADGGMPRPVMRVALVAVRTGYVWPHRQVDRPAWLVIGYANQADDFERGLPEFHRFLQRIRLGRAGQGSTETGAGLSSGFQCEPQPESQPPPEPPPPGPVEAAPSAPPAAPEPEREVGQQGPEQASPKGESGAAASE